MHAPFSLGLKHMTIQRSLGLFLLLACFSPFSFAQTDVSSTHGSRIVAVVIGVSRYGHLGGGQQLQFADRDALLVAEAVKKMGAAPDDVRVLAGQEATVGA